MPQRESDEEPVCSSGALATQKDNGSSAESVLIAVKKNPCSVRRLSAEKVGLVLKATVSRLAAMNRFLWCRL